MSLKEYEGLKFIMNKRLNSIEKQMEEVFNTYRLVYYSQCYYSVTQEEQYLHSYNLLTYDTFDLLLLLIFITQYNK